MLHWQNQVMQLGVRRDDLMSDAACTRCGSYIHSRVPIDTSESGKVHHVICVGCSFEWVEQMAQLEWHHFLPIPLSPLQEFYESEHELDDYGQLLLATAAATVGMAALKQPWRNPSTGS